MIFDIFVASYFEFSYPIVNHVIFYFEKFEEIVLATFYFCDSASLYKMVRDWQICSFSIVIYCLNCCNTLLNFINHHPSYFSFLIIKQDLTIIEFVLCKNSCIVSPKRGWIKILHLLDLNRNFFDFFTMQFYCSTNISPFSFP